MLTSVLTGLRVTLGFMLIAIPILAVAIVIGEIGTPAIIIFGIPLVGALMFVGGCYLIAPDM